MRQVGIGVMYYAKTWADDQLPLLKRVADGGFDAAEISLVNGGELDIAAYRDELQRQQLQPFCIMGINADTDLSSPDASVRRNGVEYVKRALEATAKLGSPVLCGLPYVQWLYFPDGDFDGYRDRCAASLKEVAVTAADNGVTLALEVINRFETFIFNTVAEGLAFLDQVDHPAVKLQLDTYHLNMEEDSITDAITLAGDKLGHFHCVASNRKLPGVGHLDWSAIRAALDGINYDGGLVIEAFPLPNTETGRTVNTWRPLVDDLDADAKTAAAFVRQNLIE